MKKEGPLIATIVSIVLYKEVPSFSRAEHELQETAMALIKWHATKQTRRERESVCLRESELAGE